MTSETAPFWIARIGLLLIGMVALDPIGDIRVADARRPAAVDAKGDTMAGRTERRQAAMRRYAELRANRLAREATRDAARQADRRDRARPRPRLRCPGSPRSARWPG